MCSVSALRLVLGLGRIHCGDDGLCGGGYTRVDHGDEALTPSFVEQQCISGKQFIYLQNFAEYLRRIQLYE